MVVHGTLDRMITPPHAIVLAAELNAGAEEGDMVRKEIFEGVGHVIPVEKRREFQELVEGFIEDARGLAS